MNQPHLVRRQLPRLLQGYGNVFSSYSQDYLAHVAVVCDLDDKKLDDFAKELKRALNKCEKKPPTEFCFAIEEGEAWLLGDHSAILAAYPRAKKSVLQAYRYDSICGTWEKLADAVHPGGASELERRGWQAIGHEKFKWADSIGPFVDIGRNASPSFAHFVQCLLNLGYGKPVTKTKEKQA